MDNSQVRDSEVRDVEVRYAGVVVGRGLLVKELGPDGAFVGIPEPLPVGTLVTLKMGDAVRAVRVDDVVESADPALAGMHVRFDASAPRGLGGGDTHPTPVPAAPAAVEGGTAAVADSAPANSAPSVTAAETSAAETRAAPEPGAMADAEVNEDQSGAIAAPLSLAGPAGGQQGGGKKRRKRR